MTVIENEPANPETMTVDAILTEVRVLEHKCATVASFGGSMARRYAWLPRLSVLRRELSRRGVM
jgi:hypothetical protein